MLEVLDKITRRFQASDRQARLELLLDYSRKLAPLPERFHAARDAGINVVPECQSPVFLYLERDGDGVVLHADAPREAPTVRGFVAIVAKIVAGATPADVAALPGDLLDRLGLTAAIGMTRLSGLTAVVVRVKRMAGELMQPARSQ